MASQRVRRNGKAEATERLLTSALAPPQLLSRSVSAALGLGGAVAMSSPVFAEEGSKKVSSIVTASRSINYQLTHPSFPPRQLPIYSSEAQPVKVVETHTALESHVGEARKAIVSSTKDLQEGVHNQVSKWIGVERRVEKQVLEIIPRDEALNPGLLYVGVATLAGSVFGRYREFVKGQEATKRFGC